MELWVANRLTGKSVVGRVNASGESGTRASEILAIRAAEQLSASLVELDLAPKPAQGGPCCRRPAHHKCSKARGGTVAKPGPPCRTISLPRRSSASEAYVQLRGCGPHGDADRATELVGAPFLGAPDHWRVAGEPFEHHVAERLGDFFAGSAARWRASSRHPGPVELGPMSFAWASAPSTSTSKGAAGSVQGLDSSTMGRRGRCGGRLLLPASRRAWALRSRGMQSSRVPTRSCAFSTRRRRRWVALQSSRRQSLTGDL
jgi:hypothetical protein